MWFKLFMLLLFSSVRTDVHENCLLPSWPPGPWLPNQIYQTSASEKRAKTSLSCPVKFIFSAKACYWKLLNELQNMNSVYVLKFWGFLIKPKRPLVLLTMEKTYSRLWDLRLSFHCMWRLSSGIWCHVWPVW